MAIRWEPNPGASSLRLSLSLSLFCGSKSRWASISVYELRPTARKRTLCFSPFPVRFGFFVLSFSLTRFLSRGCFWPRKHTERERERETEKRERFHSLRRQSRYTATGGSPIGHTKAPNEATTSGACFFERKRRNKSEKYKHGEGEENDYGKWVLTW